MPRIPNREDDLARPRARKGGDHLAVTKGQARPTNQPDASPEWDDGVRALWDSMSQSGQADFYQASDWAFARVVLDDLNRIRVNSRPSAEAMRGVYGALDRLLLTEGERRRARIELTAPPPERESASVVAIREYREALGVED